MVYDLNPKNVSKAREIFPIYHQKKADILYRIL
jgi:hypothetical protein